MDHKAVLYCDLEPGDYIATSYGDVEINDVEFSDDEVTLYLHGGDILTGKGTEYKWVVVPTMSISARDYVVRSLYKSGAWQGSDELIVGPYDIEIE